MEFTGYLRWIFIAIVQVPVCHLRYTENYSSFVSLSQGHIADADLGPVISPEAKNRIGKLVQSGINEGAKCILDGRNIVVPGFEKGNFVGPTILTDVTVSFYLLKNYIFQK